jgi:hypothetical protein
MPNQIALLISLFIFLGCSTQRTDKLFYWKVAEPADTRPFAIASPLKDQSGFKLEPVPLSSLDTIYLTNPSFEGYNNLGVVPKAWEDFSDKRESPPDIQPGFFGVHRKAKDGKTFVGMVYRDNKTHEAIGQYLPLPLQAGETYSFKLHVAKGIELNSLSRLTKRMIYYDSPVALTIIGYDKTCEIGKILATSDEIELKVWHELTFLLKPNFAVDHIIIKCGPPLEMIGNGAVFIDACFPIVRVKN